MYVRCACRVRYIVQYNHIITNKTLQFQNISSSKTILETFTSKMRGFLISQLWTSNYWNHHIRAM